MSDVIKTYSPSHIEELDETLKNITQSVIYIAGCTDIMIHQAQWHAASCLIDLNTVEEMRQTLHLEEKGVLIGASLPVINLIQHPVMQEKFAILIESCRQIGSIQIQNRATIGGNIANASPAGDTLPILSVLNAELWIGPRQKGEFDRLTLDQVMLGPGKNSLNGNKYIAFIYLPYPDPPDPYWYFRKVGQRYSMAISKLSLALLGWKRNNTIQDVRICAGSVSAQVKRARLTEKLLNQSDLELKLIRQASEQLMKEIKPITDIRSTKEYRKITAGRLLQEALTAWIAE
jgi:CO/xanthine dehydrogenase FAD-binding subunit